MQVRETLKSLKSKLQYFYDAATDIEKLEAEHLLNTFQIAEPHLSVDRKNMIIFFEQQERHVREAGANKLADLIRDVAVDEKRKNVFLFFNQHKDVEEKQNQIYLNILRQILTDSRQYDITTFRDLLGDESGLRAENSFVLLDKCIRVAKEELHAIEENEKNNKKTNGNKDEKANRLKVFYSWISNREILLPENFYPETITHRNSHFSV